MMEFRYFGVATTAQQCVPEQTHVRQESSCGHVLKIQLQLAWIEHFLVAVFQKLRTHLSQQVFLHGERHGGSTGDSGAIVDVDRVMST